MAAVTTAVVGIASAGVSATMSFKAAAKAKSAADKANADAAKAMADAKRKAEKDNFASLNVPLDAFEAEFENNLAVAQQNTEALQEGDARALAAGVGRIGAEAAATAEGTRINMGEQISELNMDKALSKDAINQQLIEMDVANAKEQNMRMRDSEALVASNMQSGIQSVGQGLQAGASLAPLYGQSMADKRGGKIAAQTGPQANMTDEQYSSTLGKQNYTKKQYKDIKNNGFKFGDSMGFGGKDDGLDRYWDGNKWVQGSLSSN